MAFRYALLAVALVTSSFCYARELIIENQSPETIKFSVQPAEGGWDSKDSYSREELDFLWKHPEDEKIIEIRSKQKVSLACGWCGQFKFRKLGKWWVGLPDRWENGAKYVITGTQPEYYIKKDAAPPTFVVDRSELNETHYEVSSPPDTNPSEVNKVVLSKQSGYWLSWSNDLSAMRSPIAVIELTGKRSNAFLCGNCRGVAIVSVNERTINRYLDPGTSYIVSSNGTVSELGPIVPRPQPPSAPPSAAGQLYLVNGWSAPVRFLFHSRARERLITLEAGRGEQIYCGDSCTAVIRTGKTSLRRILSPGGSYIVGLDTNSMLLDITSYGDGPN